MAENTKQFFQITEAARACGLSRSTLMRMEERGLLTPVFTAPDSGRRYYDNHNVARIMQIEKFKAMGLGSKEIADYFAQGGEAEVLLEALETRLRDLQRSVEEMRLRAAGISTMQGTLTTSRSTFTSTPTPLSKTAGRSAGPPTWAADLSIPTRSTCWAVRSSGCP